MVNVTSFEADKLTTYHTLYPKESNLKVENCCNTSRARYY